MPDRSRLFAFRGTDLSADARACITTPLGDIELACAIDGRPLASQADAARASVGTRVLTWDRGEALAELLLTAVPRELPSGVHVERLIGALWRVQARESIGAIRLECHAAFKATPSPASGQALESISWEEGGTQVTVGTTDGEGLAAALRSSPRGPRLWCEHFVVGVPEDVPLVTYHATGLRAELPGLARGETGEFHFAIAWGPEGDGAAGWLAVDIQASAIVSAVVGLGQQRSVTDRHGHGIGFARRTP